MRRRVIVTGPKGVAELVWPNRQLALADPARPRPRGRDLFRGQAAGRPVHAGHGVAAVPQRGSYPAGAGDGASSARVCGMPRISSAGWSSLMITTTFGRPTALAVVAPDS